MQLVRVEQQEPQTAAQAAQAAPLRGTLGHQQRPGGLEVLLLQLHRQLVAREEQALIQAAQVVQARLQQLLVQQ